METGNINIDGKRHVNKVGIIGQCKQCLIDVMDNLKKEWIRQNSIRKSIDWNSVIKPILANICATERLTKKDEEKIDLFHRKHLNYLIGKG